MELLNHLLKVVFFTLLFIAIKHLFGFEYSVGYMLVIIGARVYADNYSKN